MSRRAIQVYVGNLAAAAAGTVPTGFKWELTEFDIYNTDATTARAAELKIATFTVWRVTIAPVTVQQWRGFAVAKAGQVVAIGASTALHGVLSAIEVSTS